ncbi:MAG TPA: TniB family NTP-binding protein [Candidatus Obscuribacterales bacterium]
MPNQERINRIRADRWIGYTRARAVLDRLEELFTWPDKQRMPNALIIGPTNNGKSMIVEKFRRAHPVIESEALPDNLEDPDDLESYKHSLIPVVVMQMPPEPAVIRFYSVLMAATGWLPYLPQRTRVVELERTALQRLQSVKARMLVIDELHNILAGQSDVRREFLNLLRFLGNQLRIPIVGVGTRDAYLAIRSDDQLENRFEPLPLPKWQEGQDLESLLASFAAALPLRRPSEIATPDMGRYILARTEGTIGEIARLLTLAAIEAVKTGEECINAKTLERANYQSPTERRRTFERALL